MEQDTLLERFFRYVKIDTQSAEDVEDQPSTAKQRDLADLLAEELQEMGAEVDYDREFCYVYAKVPGALPALGFVSHMDTSPAASGKDVRPRLIRNYDGNDPILKTEDFPELLEHLGEDLIASDGTTLLGADDKAGVAEIMELAAYYLAHPEKPHREIRIAFTPDEEVGRGTEHFDIGRFGAKEAYTVDGGKFGEIEYECFNAAGLSAEFSGRSVHPGDAKNKLRHACAFAMEFHSMLPPWEVPEHTEGYEGFFHLLEMKGDVEKAVLKYIIRDHDADKFAARKAYAERVGAFLNEKYGEGTVKLTIRDQYRNMAEVLSDHVDLVDRAKEEMAALGAIPCAKAIRGGTDGAALSFRGVPCPNLSTGGYNFHGRFEYASLNEMHRSAELLVRLAAL